MTSNNPLMTRRGALASLAALAAASPRALAQSQNQRREIVIVEKSTEALVEITKIRARSLPLSLMRRAQGLVIIPDMVKAGFVIAGRVGRGVLVARDEAGAWSNPVFLGLAGGSFGAQIGASASDIILVFLTKKSVDDFLAKNKVTLGVDASVAAGPVGRTATAETDVKFRAEILSYSRSRGLFAGAAVSGTSLHVRERANDAFYGIPGILVGDIIAGKDPDDKPLNAPPSAARLRSTIEALSKDDADAPRDPEMRPASTRRRR